MIDPTQLTLARDAETKLIAALAACEALSEYERTTGTLAVRVAFTQLPAERVERWRAFLAEAEAGTRSARM